MNKRLTSSSEQRTINKVPIPRPIWRLYLFRHFDVSAWTSHRFVSEVKTKFPFYPYNMNQQDALFSVNLFQ